MVNISSVLPSAGSNGRRLLSAITKVVVHHDAVAIPPNGYDAVARAVSEAKFHINKGWRRLSYHYKIASDGTVFLCNPLEEVTYHAGDLAVNKAAIGICLDGNFDTQQPTPEQLRSLWNLLQELTSRRPDLPGVVRSSIKTHREVRPEPTSCPGGALQNVVEAFRV